MIPVDTMDGAGRVPAGLDALVGLRHHRKPPEGVPERRHDRLAPTSRPDERLLAINVLVGV